MKRIFPLILVLVISTCLSMYSRAQVTKIMGKVVDAETGLPVPFANIYFKGTTIGVSSDFDGKFSLETNTPSDTLVASMMGYEMISMPVIKNKFQEIVFQMKPGNISLPEVVVVAGENPAEIILRKIIRNKNVNYKKEFDYYQYEVYNKIEIDANNVSERFQNRRIMRPFKFIFEYADTSTINGKTYLPVFLSESLSNFYYRNSPKSEKEVIHAAKVSGIENESVLQYVGDMFQNYSIYENYIPLFQKNFTSPIADFGLTYYRYYLVDSAFLSDKWCYKIMFKPRRKQELTFTGLFWVHDTTFAIKSFEMEIAADANINYLNDLVLSQEFEWIDGKYWMVTLDKGVADFNILQNNKKTLGFFGRKTTTYRKFVFNHPMEKEFYSTPANVMVSENAYKKDDDFWETNRHTGLSKDEQTIYHLVDTLRNLPAFKTWVDIFETAVTGYYEMGKYEIGPYMSMLSFNSVEGARFRFGGRTTSKFSNKSRYGAYLAYGTEDGRVKYGLSALFLLNSNPRRALSTNYKDDVEQLGNSPNAFRDDFLLAAVFRRNPAEKLSRTREVNLNYDHEWFNGFSNQINLMRKEIIPVGETKIETNNGEGIPVKKESVTATEISLNTRLAYKEKFVLGSFDRYSLGTKYPILAFEYSYGVPGILNGDYEYHKVKAGIKHWFNTFNLGWSKYILEGGKIWGTLPFPLLWLQPGNETFIFDEYAYNLMNYFEFISDEYVSLYYSHHFDGFFLNRIPLMRKLKWREVVYFRGVAGSLSRENLDYNVFPPITYSLKKPYYEAGVGLENVFKVFRIDGIWRLSHFSHENTNRFALFVSFYFSF
ncbi:MAG: carboxypeptidase-like regulatory domain-containing protein [Bacteroidales bacterium]|nr:carboxypeptidase-like regulatory domain-containing protein [Bacteroidales bacterium]